MTINEETMLPSIEIKPQWQAKRSIIWLHGLGADGNDFVPIVHELGLPESLAIHFVFPHAPVRPVTINNGFSMRAWYDIPSIALDAEIDVEGIAQSVTGVENLIKKEINNGVASENIMLAGFSQGAVIALTTALTTTYALAGVITLSGYLPNGQRLTQEAKANRHIPIFQAHGTEDPVVPFAIGKATYLVLSQAGYPVEWRSYPMPHTVSMNEIEDLSNWIKQIWPAE